MLASCAKMMARGRFKTFPKTNLLRAGMSQRKSGTVKEEIWTVPNMITMTRILGSPFISAAIYLDLKHAALAGCICAAASDWLDGYIAKTFDQQSVLGAFLDPMADKIMIGALTVGLTLKDLLPLPLAMVIIGRDVILIGASFWMRYVERPDGAPFFDTTTSATFQIVPSDLSKINTGVQFLLLTLTLGDFAMLWPPSAIFLEPLWWITSVTTIGSGLSYVNSSGMKRLGKAGTWRKK